MRTPGAGRSPPPGSAVVSAAARELSRRLTPTKPTPASLAPAFASAYEIASVADCGSKTETTTIACFASAASIAVGRPFAPTDGALVSGARAAGVVAAVSCEPAIAFAAAAVAAPVEALVAFAAAGA